MTSAMNIVFAINKSYIPFCATAIASLFYHLPESERVNLYILHEDLAAEDIAAFMQREKSNFCRAATVEFIRVDDTYGFNSTVRTTGYIQSGTTYFRLYIPEIFKDKERVLYLDSDLVVCANIRPLYDTDMEGYYIAGVEDSRSKNYSQQIFLDNSSYYVNGGVLLLNIEEIQKYDLEQEYRSLLNSSVANYIVAGDQDIINIVFQSKIKYIDLKWNVFGDADMRKKQLLTICGLENSIERNDLLQAIKDHRVLHYIGKAKPWASCKSLLMKRWFFYVRMTSFAADYAGIERSASHIFYNRFCHQLRSWFVNYYKLGNPPKK